MMKLINLVCDTNQVANVLLKNWLHEEETLTFWRGSSNYAYYFTHEQKQYWLRFTRNDENSIEQILAEIDFILYLNKNNYPAVRPILSLNGRYIESVMFDSVVYYAVVFNHAEGLSLTIENITENQFECWGRSLATLHQLSSSYLPNTYIKFSWKDHLNMAREILANYPDEVNAMKELNELETFLSLLPITCNNYGLVHYDFELDNVFYDDQKKLFNVIDFDSSMYHWYIMDIVCALGNLTDLEPQNAEMGLQAFLKGYRSLRHIDEELIDLMPYFQRFDQIIHFADLLRTLEDSHFSYEPEWLKRVRPRLLKKCEDYRESFKQSII